MTKHSENTKSATCDNNVLANRLFYTRPFKMYEYGRQVYDAKDNFVFEFEKGVSKELQKEIIFSLNSLDNEPIESINLTFFEDRILNTNNENKSIICIRGWGNLTGIGGYNFDEKKALKIQDDFRDWIIYKLSTQTTS